MQIFADGKRRFQSFVGFYMINVKNSRGKNWNMVPQSQLTLKSYNLCTGKVMIHST